MKKLHHILVFGLGGFGLLSLPSCLKDNVNSGNLNAVGASFDQLASINYLNTGVNGGTTLANQNCYFMTLRVDSTYQATDSVQIETGGATIAKNVTVTIGIDAAGFDTFNVHNGGSFQLLPAADYTIDTPSTVMTAGSRAANVYIKFNTKLIDFSQKYILPIMITDAQGNTISGNYGAVMYEIVPGNQYMGLYQSVGQRVQAGTTYTIDDIKYLYDFSGITSVQGSFPTAGGHTVTVPATFIPNAVVGDCADQAIYLAVGEQMDMTVNPGNTVTVSNDNLYGFGIFTYTLVSGTCTYDPTSHVFNLSYGFTDPFSGDTSVVTEVMTRIR
jgi:hypothetical protein